MDAWLTTASPEQHLPKISSLVSAAESHFPGIQSWGVLGYCWGAKMASLLVAFQTNDSGPFFKAAVQSSPSLIDPQEAATIAVPMMMLASQDEGAEEVKTYGDALRQGPKHVETFNDQVHGWVSARADLAEGTKTRAEYERGYEVVAGWFVEHL